MLSGQANSIELEIVESSNGKQTNCYIWHWKLRRKILVVDLRWKWISMSATAINATMFPSKSTHLVYKTIRATHVIRSRIHPTLLCATYRTVYDSPNKDIPSEKNIFLFNSFYFCLSGPMFHASNVKFFEFSDTGAPVHIIRINGKMKMKEKNVWSKIENLGQRQGYWENCSQNSCALGGNIETNEIKWNEPYDSKHVWIQNAHKNKSEIYIGINSLSDL